MQGSKPPLAVCLGLDLGADVDLGSGLRNPSDKHAHVANALQINCNSSENVALRCAALMGLPAISFRNSGSTGINDNV